MCRTKLQVKQETDAPDCKQLVWSCVQGGRRYCASEGQFSFCLPGHVCNQEQCPGTVLQD